MNDEQRQQLEHAEEAVRDIAAAKNNMRYALANLRHTDHVSIFELGPKWEKIYDLISELGDLATDTVDLLAKKYGVTK